MEKTTVCIDVRGTRPTNYLNRSDAINQYLREINKYDVLTRSEEQALFQRIEGGDMEARNRIIECNQRFVFAIAKTYAKDDKVLDLMTEGNLGLIEAVDSVFDEDPKKRYDWRKGNKFMSFAVWYIRRAINYYLSNNEMVQKTNNSRTKYHLSKMRSNFYNKNGRYPTENELLDLLEMEGVKLTDKSDIYDMRIESLSETIDDDDEGLSIENTSDFIEKTATRNDYEREIELEHSASVSGAFLSILSERERNIVEHALGIGYSKEYTNDEIAEEMGMSRERVRQLKNGALKKMRSYAVQSMSLI